MARPLFTSNEWKGFWDEIWSKFVDGIRATGAKLSLVITACGIAAVTWGLPHLNRSDTSPETLGIYVLGFIIPLFCEAFLLVKDENRSFDGAVAEWTCIFLFVLWTLAFWLSLKTNFPQPATDAPHSKSEWRWGASGFLLFLLVLSLFFSFVVTGFDQKKAPKIPVLDEKPQELHDRADRHG